jgi:hypothetical protein
LAARGAEEFGERFAREQDFGDRGGLGEGVVAIAAGILTAEEPPALQQLVGTGDARGIEAALAGDASNREFRAEIAVAVAGVPVHPEHALGRAREVEAVEVTDQGLRAEAEVFGVAEAASGVAASGLPSSVPVVL